MTRMTQITKRQSAEYTDYTEVGPGDSRRRRRYAPMTPN